MVTLVFDGYYIFICIHDNNITKSLFGIMRKLFRIYKYYNITIVHAFWHNEKTIFTINIVELKLIFHIHNQ